MVATPSSQPAWLSHKINQSRDDIARETFDDAASSKSKIEWAVAVAAAVKLGSVEEGADVMHNNLHKHKREFASNSNDTVAHL